MANSELVFDNYCEIAKHIECGSDWKNWILVCKAFTIMNTYDQIARYSNHLTTLLKMFPDKPWDWYGLSQNPNITWQAILDNLDKPWNWYYISHNPNITWKNIYDNLDKPWDWSGISINPNVT